MSAAASGKSTFASAHPFHHGYRILDAATLIPAAAPFVSLILYLARVVPPLKYLVRASRFVRAKRSEQYFANVFAHIRAAPEPIVVLGRRGPADLRPYEDIVFGVVQIPWSEHERNCQRRRRQLRNPLPFFHHWTTDARKVKAARQLFLEYARRHELDVFESFEDAIAALSRRAVTQPRSAGTAAPRSGALERLEDALVKHG